uniref:Uncharacterized protein n=1 Tax=Solanum tuberosum TaxID=4113 RepID=M1DSV2_SOLTU
MAEIDNYQDSSAQSSDDVESSNDKSDSEDESSRYTQTGDEDEDPLSLPICAKVIFVIGSTVRKPARGPDLDFTRPRRQTTGPFTGRGGVRSVRPVDPPAWP